MPVPIGDPLELSDDELDDESEVTEADIEEAKRKFSNTEIAAFLLLLGYVWSSQSGAYIDLDTGDVVKTAAVRSALELVIDKAALNMGGLSQKLKDGEITLAAWQTGMMKEIKLAHTTAGAAANGGWENMLASDWGAVGQRVRSQYDYLRNFAGEIADGKQPLDGRFLIRSDMYADATRDTYEDIRRRGMISNGYDEAMRILEPGAAHCDDCEEYADDGWVSVEELHPIGDSECNVRCKCEIVYRNSETGEESE